MKKYISNEDTNLIAVYDGVLYVYHDGSWHEEESWRTDEELPDEQLMTKIDESEEQILLNNATKEL